MQDLSLTTRTDFLLSAIVEDTENILPLITEINDTFSFDETNAAEQTIETLVIAERSVVNAFWLDMSNVTQDSTLRLYHQIDGANYRGFQENLWRTTDDDGVLIAGFVPNHNVRLTVQCGGGGAGNVDIPYSVL